MLELLAQGNLSMDQMGLLLVMKFAFFLLCFCAAAPGGSFFPILVMGGYLGAMGGNWLVSASGMDPSWIGTFILLACPPFSPLLLARRLLRFYCGRDEQSIRRTP